MYSIKKPDLLKGEIILRDIYLLSALQLSLVIVLTLCSKWLLSSVDQIDTHVFLTLNGVHNDFWDMVMYLASDKYFWFPAYALLALAIWQQFKSESWKPLLVITLLITYTDQISSHLIKNVVERPRPSHNPSLMPLIHLSKAGPGGLYGFVSSHACNAAALTVFLIMLLPAKMRWLELTLIGWAALVAYSRIYNGVHYPTDVLFASAIGAIAGGLFCRVFQFWQYLTYPSLARM